MKDRVIKPATNLRGEIKLPGDKSISHRALILSSIADGDCRITGLSNAEDVKNTKKCLQALGVSITKEKKSIVVHGRGMDSMKESGKILDAGNSGTTLRLLSGILAAQNFTTTITGDESLQKRPMRRIIEPLELMGAQIESQAFKAPLKIRGNLLKAIDYASPVASAQVKSCILLAGLYAKGITRITEPSESRNHTELMLKEFQASIQFSAGMAGIKGPFQLKATDIDVPGDISAAAFFLVAGCLLKDSEIIMPNVGVNPTRTGILDALVSMNAPIQKSEYIVLNNEPREKLVTRSGILMPTHLSGSIIPRIIDEIPILAIAATQANGSTTIKDAGELRVKESDRITTVVENLKKMKANIREIKDGMIIDGPTPLKGAEIDSYGDHRIAMAFSIAGLLAEGETLVKNTDCVETSFPGFYDILESLRHD
ncbi:3-phosphoshikimate 1-carboxyvinyltransferase [candidate division KSB1 bacterium]|nr:3-phosphoshikimate 1-carboxyvinyltransferase [candidate division KSB1 bacterium]